MKPDQQLKQEKQMPAITTDALDSEGRKYSEKDIELGLEYQRTCNEIRQQEENPIITVTDFDEHSAEFKVNGVEYTITYDERELLQDKPDVRMIYDTGYGTGYHYDAMREPIWDDITTEDVAQFITDYPERWERIEP